MGLGGGCISKNIFKKLAEKNQEFNAVNLFWCLEKIRQMFFLISFHQNSFTHFERSFFVRTLNFIQYSQFPDKNWKKKLKIGVSK